MIFKEIDNIRDVGVICHYYQFLTLILASPRQSKVLMG